MAIAVVDGLEVVQIEHDEAQLAAVALRQRQGVVQQLRGGGVVEQAGEAVACHQRAQGAHTFGTDGDGGNQLIRHHGFGQKAFHANAHGGKEFAPVGLRGQIDDGQGDVVRLLADDLRHLAARAFGHVHVHEHDVGLEHAQGLQNGTRVVDLLGHHACLLQQQRVVVGDGWLIVHDQHPVGLVRGWPGDVVEGADQVVGTYGLDQVGTAVRAHRTQAHIKVAVGRDKNRRHSAAGFFFQRQQDVNTGLVALREVDVHDHGRRAALQHRRTQGLGVGEAARGVAKAGQLGGELLQHEHFVVTDIDQRWLGRCGRWHRARHQRRQRSWPLSGTRGGVGGGRRARRHGCHRGRAGVLPHGVGQLVQLLPLLQLLQAGAQLALPVGRQLWAFAAQAGLQQLLAQRRAVAQGTQAKRMAGALEVVQQPVQLQRLWVGSRGWVGQRAQLLHQSLHLGNARGQLLQVALAQACDFLAKRGQGDGMGNGGGHGWLVRGPDGARASTWAKVVGSASGREKSFARQASRRGSWANKVPGSSPVSKMKGSWQPCARSS